MASGITPNPDFEPADVMVIEDLETLKVTADPLRLRILELMENPSTVKQIADKLDLIPTKLYYHVNLLEKHKLIVLVDTQVVSGIIEKHYQTSARQLKVAPQLLTTGSDPDAENLNLTITTLLDRARDEIMEAVQSGDLERHGEGDHPHKLYFQMGTLRLTDVQAKTMYSELEDIARRYHALSEQQSHDTDLKAYRLLHLVFPKKQHKQE